jgi:uncharacterized protein YjiS (DUF1127 family)
MLKQLRDRFVTWQMYRHTIHELSWLDRHILADVGIAPSEIRGRAAAASRDLERRTGE